MELDLNSGSQKLRRNTNSVPRKRRLVVLVFYYFAMSAATPASWESWGPHLHTVPTGYLLPLLHSCESHSMSLNVLQSTKKTTRRFFWGGKFRFHFHFVVVCSTVVQYSAVVGFFKTRLQGVNLVLRDASSLVHRYFVNRVIRGSVYP